MGSQRVGPDWGLNWPELIITLTSTRKSGITSYLKISWFVTTFPFASWTSCPVKKHARLRCFYLKEAIILQFFFFFFCLCWFFVGLRSLLKWGMAALQLRCMIFTLQGPFLLLSRGSRAHSLKVGSVVAAHEVGSVSCGSQALEHRLNCCGTLVYIALQHVGSYQIWYQIQVFCIGRCFLYHWATREVPYTGLKFKNIHFCHFVCVYACSVVQLCPTLCIHNDCSPPRFFVCVIFQTRILEWAVVSSPRRSSWSRF